MTLYDVQEDETTARWAVEDGIGPAWGIVQGSPGTVVAADLFTVTRADDDGALVGLGSSGRPVVVVAAEALDVTALARALGAAARRSTWDLEDAIACAARAPEAREREAFLADWLDFTCRPTPPPTSRGVTLILVVHHVVGDLEPTLRLLGGTDFQLHVVGVELHAHDGRRVLAVQRLHEPATAPSDTRGSEVGAGTQVRTLLGRGLLQPSEELVFVRRRTGQRHLAELEGDGAIILADGSRHASPSGAARAATGLRAVDGWSAWRVPRLEGRTLREVGAASRSPTRAEPEHEDEPEPGPEHDGAVPAEIVLG